MAIETPFTEAIEMLYDSVSRKHAKTALWTNAGYAMSDSRYITREEPSAWEDMSKGLSEAFRIAHTRGKANALTFLAELADKWEKSAYVQAYSQPTRAYEWGVREVREIVREFKRF